MGEDIKYLSLQNAIQLVGAIQEEENIREQDKRVLTVYNKDNRDFLDSKLRQ